MNTWRLNPEIVDLVNATKESGKKVFAVGTTATRALETAFKDISQKDSMDIRIYILLLDISSKQLIV